MAATNIPLPLQFHNGEESFILEVLITQGHKTIIDPIDADLLQHHWCVYTQEGRTSYAGRKDWSSGKGKTVMMHRIILGRVLGRALLSAEKVDHWNGNGLDNRRENLRLATPSQNAANKKRPSNNTSGFKGVRRVPYPNAKKKWESYIKIDGKRKFLGHFYTPEEAHEAYRKAAEELFGEFARFE